nr:thymidine phosphorylase [Bacilli bacterium]
VASSGLKVMKMSGRGLGHTGGTLDKLESIPGFKIDVKEEDFLKQVNDIGVAIVGQNKELCPADKKLYALRDVTGTVNSIPLIASSIMSKKLATSCDTILLDVTVGSGAFMKDIDSAVELANLMIRIGEFHHLNTKAMISNMDEPLGQAVGNILEVKEAIETLKGRGPEDLKELCIEAGSIMLMQAHMYDSIEKAKEVLKEKLNNGEAFNKFVEMVKEQGGDISYILDPKKFEVAPYIFEVFASKDGYIERLDALALGKAAMRLGAGREVLTDPIDYKAGLYLHHKVGDKVSKGDKLITLYTSKTNFEEEVKEVENSIVITNEFVKKPQLIYKVL